MGGHHGARPACDHAPVADNTAGDGVRRRAEVMTEGSRVTPLELFFDLVFVYAFTQVTAIMGGNLTAHGLVRGLLVLAVLWWSWSGFAWLGTTLRADEGVVRAVMFAVMMAMFVAALTIPEAFTDAAGGLRGPVVFAACYLVVRILHLVVYWLGARYWVGQGGRALQRQVVRISVPMLIGATTLFGAAFASGLMQTLLWALALVVDYGGVMSAGTQGWLVPSPEHFAERHGLIIIIALGESVVSIGVGVATLPISWAIVVASCLGIAVAGALWWLYFDVVAIAAERRFASSTGAARIGIARDSYTFLHLPMVAGIILVSLGLKKVLGYAGDPQAHDLSDPLTGVGLYALYGGVVLYLLAHLGFRLRNMGSVNLPRLVTIPVLVGLVPVAAQVPALVALAMLAAVCVGLVLTELFLYAEARHRLRHAR
jgi:low temperature requirement protein LtrA